MAFVNGWGSDDREGMFVSAFAAGSLQEALHLSMEMNECGVAPSGPLLLESLARSSEGSEVGVISSLIEELRPGVAIRVCVWATSSLPICSNERVPLTVTFPGCSHKSVVEGANSGPTTLDVLNVGGKWFVVIRKCRRLDGLALSGGDLSRTVSKLRLGIDRWSNAIKLAKKSREGAGFGGSKSEGECRPTGRKLRGEKNTIIGEVVQRDTGRLAERESDTVGEPVERRVSECGEGRGRNRGRAAHQKRETEALEPAGAPSHTFWGRHQERGAKYEEQGFERKECDIEGTERGHKRKRRELEDGKITSGLGEKDVEGWKGSSGAQERDSGCGTCGSFTNDSLKAPLFWTMEKPVSPNGKAPAACLVSLGRGRCGFFCTGECAVGRVCPF